MPLGKDERILKDEIIIFSGKKTVYTDKETEKLRRAVVYKEDENKMTEVICNILAWSPAAIA